MKTHKNRFWSKVNKTSNCWEWTGSKDGKGYGQFSANCKRYSTHRFSFELKYGKIPNGLCVLHHCDNPSCVRPDHLFLGTVADNNRDSIIKGRNFCPIGEDNGRSKLTKRDVSLIRELYSRRDTTHIQLAQQFNVCSATICYIVNNQTWKHIK